MPELCGFGGPYIKDPGVIYSGNDLANEVEKRFFKKVFFNIQKCTDKNITCM